MSLKLKDEDSTKRMKDMQEELKDPSLGGVQRFRTGSICH